MYRSAVMVREASPPAREAFTHAARQWHTHTRETLTEAHHAQAAWSERPKEAPKEAQAMGSRTACWTFTAAQVNLNE